MELSKYVQELRDIVHENGVYEIDDIVSLYNIHENDDLYFMKHFYISYIKLRNRLKESQEEYINKMSKQNYRKTLECYRNFMLCKHSKYLEYIK